MFFLLNLKRPNKATGDQFPGKTLLCRSYNATKSKRFWFLIVPIFEVMFFQDWRYTSSIKFLTNDLLIDEGYSISKHLVSDFLQRKLLAETNC